jgi:hypothetical protein
MPIIESALPTAPLSQGDLLSGVPLFVTNKSDEASRTAHRLCLVLSRPCVALRKAIVVVAAVEKYPDDVPKDLDSFDRVLKFLTTSGVLLDRRSPRESFGTDTSMVERQGARQVHSLPLRRHLCPCLLGLSGDL